MEKQESIEQEPLLPRRIKPLVFISHDTRDAELAEAFSTLLNSVSMGILKTFRSSDRKGNQGITYGVEWYPEIMRNLGNASDVVALLTEHSVNRPWILYEAGVAKGKLDTPLLGIALGIPLEKATNGPFAQFQNCADDIDSLTRLVLQLVQRIPDSEPDTTVIKMQVEVFKRKCEEILKKKFTAQTKASDATNDTSVAKLFEEIKIMFQDLTFQPEKNTYSHISDKNINFGEFYSVLKRAGSQDSDNYHLGFLIIISLFKDELPWLYEAGKETYSVLKSGVADSTKKKSIINFKALLESSTSFVEGIPYLWDNSRKIKDLILLLQNFALFYDKKRVY